MRRSAILLLAVVGALLSAAPAHAGTYGVHACATAAGKFANRSWTFSVPSTRWSTATTCPTDAARPELTINLIPGSQLPAGEVASMTFVPPRGAGIRDFALTRQIYYYNPTEGAGALPPYVLYSWGGLAFSGAGEYDAATREAINAAAPSQWYGYPSGAFDTGAPTVTRASFPRLTGQPDASSLTIQLGCFTSAPCSLRGGADPANPPGTVYSATFGASVTVADESRPSVSALADAGLLAAGSHGGEEGAIFSARDNVGIRSAELIDLTDPANARVVGRRTFPCDFSRPRPCNDAGRGSVAPSARLPVGTRTLAVRVIDTAGNRATTPPRGVLVGGPLNGTNASATGRLRAVFTKDGRTRRTVKAGGQPAVSLSLRTAAKLPIGGARIRVRVRQLRTGARFRSAPEVRTGADGRARALLPRGTSRELRFEYRTRVDDPSPALRAGVRLGVRPRATLSVRPRRVGYGGAIRLSGRVKSRPRPSAGKLIVLQAFDRGRWRTFAATRSRKGGRFSRRYRFTRTFRPRSYRFRARLPREGAYPYATGNTRTVRVRVG